MVTNNIINVNDCDFTEKVVAEFDRIAAAFETDNIQEDVILLNFNTKVLNEEIVKFRGNRFGILLKKPLTSFAKREFETQFVPDQLKNEYRSRVLTNLDDLAKYVASKFELNRRFSDKNSVVESIGRIEPQTYQTFGNQYPAVAERLRSGPITSAEVRQLSRQYGFDLNNLADRIKTSISGFLGLLQRLFSGMGLGLGLMGSFCSLIDNVFGPVTGIRNASGNAAALSGDLPRLISSISPRTGEMLQTVQQIRGIVERVQGDASTTRMSMQDAFGLIASAMNIVLKFYNPSTKERGGVELEWDFVKIKEAIEDAISNIEQEKLLFIDAQAEDGRPLADFNNDGIVDQADLDLLQDYIDETLQDPKVVKYIETVMLPFMVAEIKKYKEYTIYSTSSSNSGGVDISGVVEMLSAASQLFGSPSNPSGGDFGLSQLSSMLGNISGIESQIRGFASRLQGGQSININSLLSQISQLRSAAQQVSGSIFGDSRATLNEFRTTTERALEVAERVSVSEPERTREIQESRQSAIGENITRALNISARATSEIIPILNQRLTGLQGLLRNAAAVGVVDAVESRLTSVVEQSARQLETVARAFSPTSLDNRFNFNMAPVFARFAGLQARALAATTEDSVEHVQNVVRGNLAQAVRNFRSPNREDVEFIALRACNLAGELERIYNGMTEPLQQMVGQFQATMPALEGRGAEISAAAVAAGAIRLPSSARPAAAAIAAAIPATATTLDPATGAPLPGGAVPAAPGTIPATARGPSPRNPAEYADLPTYEDVYQKTWQGLFRYGPGNRTRGSLLYQGLPLSLGWDYIRERESDTMRAFVALARAWKSRGNPSFTVSSAYRAPGLTRERISALQRLPRSQWIGGVNPVSLRVEATQHARGKAFDCLIGGPRQGSLQQQFAALARSLDFRGIGYYSWGVHVDTGSTRQWIG